MSKLGVIMDGISRDLEHALQVLTEAGLKYAELQFVWDAEVGDHTDEQINKIKELITKYDVQISCISRHIFGGVFLMGTEIGDDIYKFHMEKTQAMYLYGQRTQYRSCTYHEFSKRNDSFWHSWGRAMDSNWRCLG